MATNPNDVARALNEMVKTLQELSDRELESVESIFLEKKKSIELARKIEESKKELTRLQLQDELKEKKVRKEEVKTLKFNKNLLGFVDKTSSKLKMNLFDFSPKEKSKDLFKSFIQQEKAKVLSFTRMFTKKQSSEDFSRTGSDDVSGEQLNVLKEIDYKIGKLTGQSSGGGLFDTMFSSLKDMIGNVASEAGGVAKILAMLGLGAAVTKGASGKGGILRNVVAAGLKASRNGNLSKGGKIGLVTGGASVIGAGLYAGLSGNDEEESLQTRKVGGKVSNNSVYLVGENGPELFSPKQNGFIIPNNKLKQNNGYDVVGPSDFELFSKSFKKNIKMLLSNIEGSVLNFDKVVVGKIKNVYDNVKKWISGKVNDVVDTVSNGVQDFKKKIATKVDDILGTTFSKPSIETPIQTIEDNRVINYPETKFPKLSPPTLNTNFEMNIPKLEPIQIENNFRLEKSESILQDTFDKSFWVNDFIGKFREGLKKKENNQRVKYNIVSSPTL